MSDKHIENVEYTSFVDACKNYLGSKLAKNIFFDTEFSTILPLVKQLKEVCDHIQMRIEQRDFVEVSGSKYAYINLVDNENKSPEIVYFFRFRTDIVRIIRVHRRFHIACSFKPRDLSPFRDIPDIYGDFDDLESAKPAFVSACNELLRKVGYYGLF